MTREILFVGGQRALAATTLLLGFAHSAQAQLPSPSARALGMGDNYTAAARGYSALSWNPALLDHSERPREAMAVFNLRGTAGFGPVGLTDLADWAGETVPDAVKQQWLDKVATEGRQAGAGGADFTYLAASVYNFGFQVGTIVRSAVDLNPDAAEVLLFGNAGRTGEPRRFDLGGARLDFFMTTTFALGYGRAIELQDGRRLSLGATFKYIRGNDMLHAQCDACTINDEPLEAHISFPVLQQDTSMVPSMGRGSGTGLDLGVALEAGSWTFGASLQNVYNTFRWSEERMYIRPGEALLTENETTTSFDPVRMSQASPELQALGRAFLEDMRFRRGVSLGAEGEIGEALTVTADAHLRSGEGIQVGPKRHIGVGAELHAIPVLSLRGGVAVADDGFQLAAGLGIRAGFYNMNFAAARVSGDGRQDNMLMFGISFGGR